MSIYAYLSQINDVCGWKVSIVALRFYLRSSIADLGCIFDSLFTAAKLKRDFQLAKIPCVLGHDSNCRTD